MTAYKSKVSLGLFIPLFAILTAVFVLMIANKLWFGVVFQLIVISFIVLMFINTFYQIEGNILIIRNGILYKQKIDINTIIKISPTNNPLSSPALSFDRLEIKYNKSSWVMISPKEKEKFIQHLLSINSAIEVVARKK